MSVRRFFTTGKFDIQEEQFELADIEPNEIRVKTLLVGICRSDVDMYLGEFNLPKEMQGHEGLGEVIQVGSNVTDVEIGDIVSTNADNCFADYYNAPEGMFIKVPSKEPKYILEPVACAFNIMWQIAAVFHSYNKNPEKIMVIGTGFLAKIIVSTIKNNTTDLPVDILVVGNSNKEFFAERDIRRIDKETLLDNNLKNYDLIIDLSSTADINYLIDKVISHSGVYVVGSKKDLDVSINFETALWKAVTVLCPSPRGPIEFIRSFESALDFVNTPANSWISESWTNEYSRDDAAHGFKDACSRGTNYGRGYINFETE